MAVIQLVMLHNAFRCNLPDHYTNETEIGKEGERETLACTLNKQCLLCSFLFVLLMRLSETVRNRKSDGEKL